MAGSGIPDRADHRRVRLHPPGIRGLGFVLTELWELLEPDFLRFYRIDLVEAIWGPGWITARRLAVLVKGLPAESEFARHLGAPRPGDWGNLEELGATGLELSWQSMVLFMAAHVKKGTRLPKPIRIPRPSDPEREARRQATPAEMARFFGGGKGRVQYTPKTVDETKGPE